MANDVSKEQMQAEIKVALGNLRDHAVMLSKLIENLTRTMQGDISFVLIEDATAVLDKLPECKEVITTLSKMLKARVKTRMKDL